MMLSRIQRKEHNDTLEKKERKKLDGNLDSKFDFLIFVHVINV